MNEYRNGLGDQITPTARDFVATFARFEFALTRGGFLLGEIGEQGEAHWDRFANHLGIPFLEDMRSRPEARLFFSDPPKKLIRVSDHDVEFQRTNDIETPADLFLLVRRVRNNLFHGQKIPFDDRDRQLVQAALFVLDAALHAAGQRQDLRGMTLAFTYAAINSY